VTHPGTTNPPPSNPGTRPTVSVGGTHHDQTAIQHELDAALDVITGDNASARRVVLRRLGEIYEYRDLPDDMRADAARQSGSGYSSIADEARTQNDAAAERAALRTMVDWYQKTNQLAPSNKLTPLIAAGQARIQELGNP
jgi:hypothetical protein